MTKIWKRKVDLNPDLYEIDQLHSVNCNCCTRDYQNGISRNLSYKWKRGHKGENSKSKRKEVTRY